MCPKKTIVVVVAVVAVVVVVVGVCAPKKRLWWLWEWVWGSLWRLGYVPKQKVVVLVVVVWRVVLGWVVCYCVVVVLGVCVWCVCG